MNIKTDLIEVKPMRKILPYSVKPIGGPEDLLAWKQEQTNKQAVWDLGKADRYMVAKSNSVQVIMNGSPGLSYEDKREIEALKEMNELSLRKPTGWINGLLYFEPTPKDYMNELRTGKPSGLVTKTSIVTTVCNEILTWFMKINFEPK